MDRLPTSLDAFGPVALSAVAVAVYLVLGEPLVGAVLHRRFEGRLRVDGGARRSFYRRLLLLEWGLALLAVLVWLGAPDVDAAAVGLQWPTDGPGPVSGVAALAVVVFVLVTTRALRGGALTRLPPPPAAGTSSVRGRHAETPQHAMLALLPRTTPERRLFTLVGLTAGICEEWLYRAFLLVVLSALTGGLPSGVLVVVAAGAFGLAHLYQGVIGVLTTAVLGAVLAGLYLDTGSLLLPVLLHALVDLRFLAVPAAMLPTAQRP